MKSLSPLRSLGRLLPRLFRRVFLLLCCCWYAAFTGQAPAALVAANQPAVWPDHEPYGTVGGRYGNGYTAKLPMPLIAVLRPLLGEEPLPVERPANAGLLRPEPAAAGNQRDQEGSRSAGDKRLLGQPLRACGRTFSQPGA